MLNRISKRLAGMVIAGSLAAPLAMAAPEPQYTYGEVGFSHTDVGDGIDGDGLAVRGSYALHPNVHAIVGFEALSLDRRTDGTWFNIGAGFNMPFRPGLDGVFRVSFVHANVDPPGPGDHDADGFSLEVLGRVMLNEELELNAGVRYLDLDSSNTAFRLGAQYFVTRQLSLGGDLSISSDGTGVFVGGRWNFDPPWTLQRVRR
jgi:hypothetical protein